MDSPLCYGIFNSNTHNFITLNPTNKAFGTQNIDEIKNLIKQHSPSYWDNCNFVRFYISTVRNIYAPFNIDTSIKIQDSTPITLMKPNGEVIFNEQNK